MKLIKFLKPFSPYAVGDVTGVNDKDAERLIKESIAASYKEEKAVDAPVEDKMVVAPIKKK